MAHASSIDDGGVHTRELAKGSGSGSVCILLYTLFSLPGAAFSSSLSIGRLLSIATGYNNVRNIRLI